MINNVLKRINAIFEANNVVLLIKSHYRFWR